MDNSTIQRVKQRYGIVGNSEALNRAIEIAPENSTCRFVGADYR